MGCRFEEFRDIIRIKMDIYNAVNDTKMTFDNIHFDHIKPVRAFKLEDKTEIGKCVHYTNMQPLLAQDNLTKSGTWSEIDEDFWCKNIIHNPNFLDIYMPNTNTFRMQVL